MPSSLAKARAKLRSLMWRAPRQRGHRQVGRRGCRRSTPAARAAARARRVCAASWALNCDWPPGRLTNSTSQRADLERRLAAEVLLDQREREVHAGGDAGRGVDVPVADEDRVALDRRPPGSARPARRSRPSGSSRGARRAGPASASRNAPVQTEHTRRERAAAARTPRRPSRDRARASARPCRRRRPACRSGRGSRARLRSATRPTVERADGPRSGATNSTA